MGKAAQRLMALRREGVSMVRNPQFDFFEIPENRAALRLSRELVRWRDLLLDVPEGEFRPEDLEIDTLGYVILTLRAKSWSALYRRRFSWDEFRLFCDQPDVTDIFEREGVSDRLGRLWEQE
jgi:hypothetical protein